MNILKSLLSNCVALMFVLTVATLSYGAMYTIDTTRVLPDDEITTTVFENIEMKQDEGAFLEVTENGDITFVTPVKYNNVKSGFQKRIYHGECDSGVVYNDGKIIYEKKVEYNENVISNRNEDEYSEHYFYLFAGAEYNNGIIEYYDEVKYKNNKTKVNFDDDSSRINSTLSFGGGCFNNGDITYNSNVIYSGNISQDTLISKDGSSMAEGSALYNWGDINYKGNVTYENNMSQATSIGKTISDSYGGCDVDVYGGAVYNDEKINYGNNVTYINNVAKGKAISSNMIVTPECSRYSIEIYCDGNHVYGGAIYNEGKIVYGDNILHNGNKIELDITAGTATVESEDSYVKASPRVYAYSYGMVKGGAVANDEGKISYGNNITYSNNISQIISKGGNVTGFERGCCDADSLSYGGGVYNRGTIDYNGKVEFKNNKVQATAIAGIVKNCVHNDAEIFLEAIGGALYDEYNESYYDNETYGMIIFNNESIFEGNSVEVKAVGGKVLVSTNTAEIDISIGAFAGGGAISATSWEQAEKDFILFNKKATFKNNSVKMETKKGVIEYDGITKEELDIEIEDNVFSVSAGGAISIGIITCYDESIVCEGQGSIKFNDTAEFIDNSVEGDNAYGGALANIGGYNESKYYEDDEDYGIVSSTTTFINGAIFKDNKAVSKDGQALGGAIYSRYSMLNLTANTNDVEFTGNTANGKSSAIYDECGTINLQALNTGKIIFNDSIESKDETSTININVLQAEQEEPSAYGKVILNANMNGYKGTVNIDNGTVLIDKEGTWFENASAVNVAKATIQMINDTIQTHNFNNVTLTNSLYLTVDVDLAKGEMDTINFTNFISNTGKAKPIEVTELNVLSDKEGTTILTFTDTVAEQVFTNITTVTSKDEGEYDVSYDETTGKFTFVQIKAPVKPQPTPSIDISKSIMNVVSSAMDTVQSNVMNQVFVDMNNKVDSLRQARNKGGVLYASAVNQVFENERSISRGLWLRPFGMQEDIEVNGTKIETKSYGTLAGLDLVAGDKELVNVYIGVTGADQKKNELKVDQVNYLLGASAMYVEDNWYVGLTANVGTNKSTVKEENKQDEFNTMVYTVGLKGGYNIDLSSKVSIEPNVTAWYGNTTSEEYDSKVVGTKVGQNTTNKVEVKPAVKVKINLPKDWMPYATIGYAFNLSKDNEISVRPIDELGTDGYAEYGIGVNKTFNRFDVYLQGTGRCGGRDGYGANAGIKYAF